MSTPPKLLRLVVALSLSQADERSFRAALLNGHPTSLSQIRIGEKMFWGFWLANGSFNQPATSPQLPQGEWHHRRRRRRRRREEQLGFLNVHCRRRPQSREDGGCTLKKYLSDSQVFFFRLSVMTWSFQVTLFTSHQGDLQPFVDLNKIFHSKTKYFHFYIKQKYSILKHHVYCVILYIRPLHAVVWVYVDFAVPFLNSFSSR